MKKFLTILLISSLFLVGCFRRTQTETDAEFFWVDTHTHPYSNIVQAGSLEDVEDCLSKECLAQIVQLMENAGMQMALLMHPPSVNGGSSEIERMIAEAAQSDKEHFVYVGGGSVLNTMIHTVSKQTPEVLKEQFQQKTEELLSYGVVGFGEMSVLHLSFGESHAFEEVAADHPLFLLLADIAAAHDMPIDIHMDLVVEDMATPIDILEKSSKNPDTLKGNLDGFENLLNYNPNAKIIWAHVGANTTGVMTLDLLRTLMENHPNLYMQIRGGKLLYGDNWVLDKNGTLNAEWQAFFEMYPDRFLVGSDTFFSGETDTVEKNLNTDVNFLKALPEDLARQFGCENPKALFRLNIECSNIR